MVALRSMLVVMATASTVALGVQPLSSASQVQL